MKWRWHLLAICLSLAVAIPFWLWLQEAVWSLNGLAAVSYAGHEDESHELKVIVKREPGDSYYAETYDWRDGRLLRKAPLEGTHERKNLFVIANQSTRRCAEAPLAVAENVSGNQTSGRWLIWLFDPQTGKLCQPNAFSVNNMNQVTLNGARLVILSQGKMKLFESKHDVGRTIDSELAISVVTDPMHFLQPHVFMPPDTSCFFVACNRKLFVVNWKTGQAELVMTLKGDWPIVSLSKNGDIIIGRYDSGLVISLWRWNGSRMEQLTDEVTLGEEESGKPRFALLWRKEDYFGNLHIGSYALLDWPVGLRPVFRWLTAKGIDVKKYYPLKTYLMMHVLNHRGQEIGKYELSEYSTVFLDQRYSVEFPRGLSDTASVVVRRMVPTWPNTLACGIVLYLGLYVAGRLMWSRPA